MYFDITFSDAIYVVYAAWRNLYYSPSTSVWMIPGTYED